MNNSQQAPSLRVVSPSGTDEPIDVVRAVMARTRQRTIMRDLLDLAIAGFGKTLLGLLGTETEHPAGRISARGNKS